MLIKNTISFLQVLRSAALQVIAEKDSAATPRQPPATSSRPPRRDTDTVAHQAAPKLLRRPTPAADS